MARTTPEGIDCLVRREGKVLKMYRDSAGLPTIGVGHLLTKDELRSGKIGCLSADWHVGLTEDQAEELLRNDLNTAERAVEDYVIVPLSPHQHDALVSFVFNVGTEAFRSSTLLKQLNNKQYQSVPTQLRRWIYAAGERNRILVARREDEIRQWNGQ